MAQQSHDRTRNVCHRLRETTRTAPLMMRERRVFLTGEKTATLRRSPVDNGYVSTGGRSRVWGLMVTYTTAYSPTEKNMPDSSWVATRRGLHKPVSSSPPFKTGLAAFTAPGLAPAILLRDPRVPRSVPSHFLSIPRAFPADSLRVR